MVLFGFKTSVGAAFIATFDELRTALPGWRVPLPAPVKRMGLNPFTQEPLLIPSTRDPGPDVAPDIPSTLSFQAVLLPAVEDWEDRYLALDFALSQEPGLAAAERDTDVELQRMLDRGLCEEPLFGGSSRVGDPRFLTSVPERIVAALSSLSTEAVPELLDEWNRRSASPSSLATLHALRELALLAIAQGRLMFIWQVHPYHR